MVAYTSTSMDVSVDQIDVTTGDSTNGWKEFLNGEKGATLQVDGLYDPAAANGNVSDVFSQITSEATVTWEYGETGVGQPYWSGSANVSALNLGGPKNEGASYSFTLQVTGEVTEGVR